MMNFDHVDSKNMMYTYLPKEVGSFEVKCNNEVLRQKIEKLFENVYSKLHLNDDFVLNSDLDWDMNDYSNFRNRLGKMTLSGFEFVYDAIMYYLSFSKSEIEYSLRILDQNLNLHCFDDEKILATRKEVITQDDGTEKVILRQEYAYVKHHFNTGDIVQVFSSFYSKVNQYGVSNIIKFQNQISSKTLQQQIDDFNFLLEQIHQKDEDIMNSLMNPFDEWVSPISHSSISFLVQSSRSIIIGIAEHKAAQILRDMHTKMDYEIRDYASVLSLRYQLNKLRKPRKH